MKLFAVWSPAMSSAVETVNETSTCDMLVQIVPDATHPGSVWILYRDDGGRREGWLRDFPNAEVLPRDLGRS